jgi:PKD repeat protein
MSGVSLIAEFTEIINQKDKSVYCRQLLIKYLTNTVIIALSKSNRQVDADHLRYTIMRIVIFILRKEKQMSRSPFATWIIMLLLLFSMAACNLNTAPEEEISNTQIPTTSVTGTINAPVGTATGNLSTGLPPFSTQSLPPTSVVQLPPTFPAASTTPSLTSVFIISPVPGNVVAGNVQVLGSAIHPNFLQYQLEFGPDPNPGNLWYLIGGVRLVPVTNNLLGVWSTTDGRSPDGNYQLRLRVFLRDGSVVQTVVNNIRVQNQVPTLNPTPTQSVPRPIAAFIANPTSGRAPLVVTFSNRSSGNITSYSWNFGDGSTSAEANPIHTYRTGGSYEVRLTVSGPGGQSNVSAIIDVKTADPPVANFTADRTSGASPLTVQFTDQSTGPIESYLWDFGDGVTTNERNPRHTFSEPRLYNVILQVSGPGGTDRRRMVIVVENQQVAAPVADFTASLTTGDAPLSVSFTSRSSGQVNSYEWDFNGDGIIDSNDQNPTYIYQNPGTYNVRFTVFGNGGRDDATGTITVNRPPQAPEANFTADRTEGDFPLTVRFNNTSTGTVTAYQWDFNGDSVTDSTDQNPSYTFTEPGTYNVTLFVTGANNTRDSSSMTIAVTEPLAPPEAAFNANPTSGSAPLTVTFTNQSSGDNLSFAWNFGDNTSSLTQDASFTHTYQTNGTYTVTLTVTNSEGTTDTATQTITVSDALNAAFNATALSSPSQTFQFQSNSSGAIANYRWDFGDGTIIEAGQPTVTHTYNRAGTYNVTLTIRDANGTQSSVTLPVNVVAPTTTPTATFTATVPPTATATTLPPTPTATETAAPVTQIPLPVASFTVQAGDAGTYFFTDTSQPENTITTWAWDFGDGTTSNEQDPTHQYTGNGQYTVRLVVSNTTGSSEASQVVSVNNIQPTLSPLNADFRAEAGENGTVNFVDQSTPQEAIVAREWDFNGDTIIDSTDANPTFTFTENRTYTVTLTVRDAAGTSDTATQEITATNVQPTVQPLNADFRAEAVENGTVNFVDQSTPQEAIVAREWDFNGDTIIDSTDANPTFTFTENRTYTVTFTVRDVSGASDTATQEITVTNVQPTVQPLNADFTFEVAQDGTVTFTDVSTPQDSIATRQWDFNGDTIIDSTEQTVTFTFTQIGLYPVTLTVLDGAGNDSTVTKDISIEAIQLALDANFRFEAVGGGVYNFFDESTPTEGVSYTWSFGDGESSLERNPQHTFTANGNYDVTLTITDANNQSAAETLTVEVTDANGEAPDQPEETLSDTTPVQPDIESLVRPLSNLNQGDPNVFTVVGDKSFRSTFLRPFTPDNYSLGGQFAYLQPTIDGYNEMGSFSGENWLTDSELNVEQLLATLDGDNCEGSQFECHLQNTNAGVVVITVGLWEAQEGVDLQTFRDQYNTLLTQAIDRGIIPVVMTIYPRPDLLNEIRAVNDVIIEVAQEKQIPVVNVWRMFNEITANGGNPFADENGVPVPSVAPEGAGRIGGNFIQQFGENARNYNVLNVLTEIRNRVFGLDGNMRR